MKHTGATSFIYSSVTQLKLFTAHATLGIQANSIDTVQLGYMGIFLATQTAYYGTCGMPGGICLKFMYVM